jgi:ArsR family transcriptional regulator, arsenate/arsenite/antimonite-responsive transcriptional repressor
MNTHVVLNAPAPPMTPVPTPLSPLSTHPQVLDPLLLKLFSEPLRARLVGLLASEQLCTCHLAEETGALATAVSNHLRQLREAGLVETETCGRYTYYRLRPEALERVAAQFTDLAAAARTATKRPC